ncbi:octaprenyl diphosphate synthase [Pseudomaricurvus sp. HS19]|uniref:octaprenyl diphosphate synthase n=1 Tax=Pseudomaricurvus sp. HS19 TaxID=2692626 RepID=UPI00136D5C17|nr:octaprenyl diphosphate synthase [Pseudomaricurvus sp. HS19]MYM64576.1 octaprenyl diphosphate synthase [Pseudomaricurvus sp. HS19]
MLPFHKAVEADFAAVNQLIIEQLHSNVGLVENIGHYLVEAGGKRLRPLLVLLTANALNYPARGKQHLDLAAIIEFIHTATLLHDDVVDISNMRRGRPTANAKWGNAPSVLVGDFLYSRAFQMMVAIGSMEIMQILSDTTNTISEGEVQQLVNAKDPTVSEANYLEVIYKKTGALFEAACDTAAVLADATAEQRQALKRYGYHLGLAFQLIDDALDYEGDAETLGKNVGDDLAEGKPTLPLIQAMAQGTAEESALIADAIREGALDQLQAVVAIVQRTGALQYTTDSAKEQADLAIAQLEHLPDSPYRQAMTELAHFAVGRDH